MLLALVLFVGVFKNRPRMALADFLSQSALDLLKEFHCLQKLVWRARLDLNQEPTL